MNCLSNELDRISNELDRISNELDRISHEFDRISNELDKIREGRCYNTLSACAILIKCAITAALLAGLSRFNTSLTAHRERTFHAAAYTVSVAVNNLTRTISVKCGEVSFFSKAYKGMI